MPLHNEISWPDAIVTIASDPRAIATTAIGAMAYPIWATWIDKIHDEAAYWLPIIGLILALVQLIALILRIWRS